MGDVTPVLGLPYPDGTDLIMNGDDAIRALAERVEALLAPSWAWKPWTPTLTGITPSALLGRYRQQGTTVHAMCSVHVGSAGGSGALTMTFPVPPAPSWAQANSALEPLCGISMGFNSNTGIMVIGGAFLETATGARLYFLHNGGAPWTPTSPWTWAAGMMLRCNITYEAATAATRPGPDPDDPETKPGPDEPDEVNPLEEESKP